MIIEGCDCNLPLVDFQLAASLWDKASDLEAGMMPVRSWNTWKKSTCSLVSSNFHSFRVMENSVQFFNSFSIVGCRGQSNLHRVIVKWYPFPTMKRCSQQIWVPVSSQNMLLADLYTGSLIMSPGACLVHHEQRPVPVICSESPLK